MKRFNYLGTFCDFGSGSLKTKTPASNWGFKLSLLTRYDK